MNNNSEEAPFTASANVFDVFLICFGVVAITVTFGSLWDEGSGKGKYLFIELLILLFALAYLYIRRIPILPMLRWSPVPLRFVIPLIGIAVGTAILLDELDRLVSLMLPLPDEEVERLKVNFTPASVYELFLLVLGIGIIAPFVEESIFRGIVQQILERRIEITKGILLTSLIFAFVHINPWWFVQLLLMSVWLGYLAWQFNSIIPPLLIHMANNLWSLLLLNQADNYINYYLWEGHINPLWWVLAAYLVWKGHRFILSRNPQLYGDKFEKNKENFKD